MNDQLMERVKQLAATLEVIRNLYPKNTSAWELSNEAIEKGIIYLTHHGHSDRMGS